MSIEVFDRPHSISSTFYLHFVWLHCLLNARADLSQPGIDACFSDAGIGGVFDGLKELIVGGIEGDSKRAVNDPAFNLGPKVDFADVIICDNGIVSGVGSIVSSHMVEWAPSREGDSGL